jgi:DNA-binding NarL/FixJ family response regulator
MDINMPELNGVEATRQVLRESSSIKVIGLSIMWGHDVRERMIEAGAVNLS